jgi:hypothetical protein
LKVARSGGRGGSTASEGRSGDRPVHHSLFDIEPSQDQPYTRCCWRSASISGVGQWEDLV